jgi:HEAT repeat protein
VQERIAAFCASEGLRCLDLLPAALARIGPVRQHAARALGRIGPAARPAAAALQRATGDGDAEVRRAARQALDLLH